MPSTTCMHMHVISRNSMVSGYFLFIFSLYLSQCTWRTKYLLVLLGAWLALAVPGDMRYRCSLDYAAVDLLETVPLAGPGKASMSSAFLQCL